MAYPESSTMQTGGNSYILALEYEAAFLHNSLDFREVFKAEKWL